MPREPLISKADNKRHYELFCGITNNFGKTWKWKAITANSNCDNIRPIIPKWDDDRIAIIWMRGKYEHNRGKWATAVVALFLTPNEIK